MQRQNEHRAMKIWGWLGAIFFSPVGIVLGLMLRKRGQSIGTWIAGVSAVALVIGVISIASSPTTPQRSASTAPTAKPTQTTEAVAETTAAPTPTRAEQAAARKREVKAAAERRQHRLAVARREAAQRKRDAAQERRELAAMTKTYGGADTQNLGTIRVPRESRLRWSSPGGANANFIILNDLVNDADMISVNSLNRTHGTTVVSAGTYHKVDVIGSGEWSFTISPR
jgi:hypothetical protein